MKTFRLYPFPFYKKLFHYWFCWISHKRIRSTVQYMYLWSYPSQVLSYSTYDDRFFTVVRFHSWWKEKGVRHVGGGHKKKRRNKALFFFPCRHIFSHRRRRLWRSTVLVVVCCTLRIAPCIIVAWLLLFICSVKRTF